MKAPRPVQVVALSVILVLCFAATAPAAIHAVSSITPDNGDAGVAVSVTIGGYDFEAGETVALKKTGSSNINGTSVVK